LYSPNRLILQRNERGQYGFQASNTHPHYVVAVANRMRDTDSHVYLHDANYNVTALLEDDAKVVERYAYTPYGEVAVLDADFSADGDEKSDVENRYLYTG